jgi:hypothetical protein
MEPDGGILPAKIAKQRENLSPQKEEYGVFGQNLQDLQNSESNLYPFIMIAAIIPMNGLFFIRRQDPWLLFSRPLASLAGKFFAGSDSASSALCGEILSFCGCADRHRAMAPTEQHPTKIILEFLGVEITENLSLPG